LSIRVLVLYRYGSSRDPHSFPTRRSSDLDRRELTFNVSALFNWGFGVVRAPDPDDHARPGDTRLDRLRYGIAANVRWKQLDVYRSEEHTSELQSRFDLVCRLLLEKKKIIR